MFVNLYLMITFIWHPPLHTPVSLVTINMIFLWNFFKERLHLNMVSYSMYLSFSVSLRMSLMPSHVCAHTKKYSFIFMVKKTFLYIFSKQLALWSPYRDLSLFVSCLPCRRLPCLSPIPHPRMVHVWVWPRAIISQAAEHSPSTGGGEVGIWECASVTFLSSPHRLICLYSDTPWK